MVLDRTDRRDGITASTLSPEASHHSISAFACVTEVC